MEPMQFENVEEIPGCPQRLPGLVTQAPMSDFQGRRPVGRLLLAGERRRTLQGAALAQQQSAHSSEWAQTAGQLLHEQSARRTPRGGGLAAGLPGGGHRGRTRRNQECAVLRMGDQTDADPGDGVEGSLLQKREQAETLHRPSGRRELGGTDRVNVPRWRSCSHQHWPTQKAPRDARGQRVAGTTGSGPPCAGWPGCPPSFTDITEVEYHRSDSERGARVGPGRAGRHSLHARVGTKSPRRRARGAGRRVVQRRSTPDAATYIGSGKAAELHDIVMATEADTVICDGEPTPGQLRKLENVVKVKVVDRTWLILDIFAQHAQSKEGKAQVSPAQMEYLLPRLRGMG